MQPWVLKAEWRHLNPQFPPLQVLVPLMDVASSIACFPGLGLNLVFARDPGVTAEGHGIKLLILPFF